MRCDQDRGFAISFERKRKKKKSSVNVLRHKYLASVSVLEQSWQTMAQRPNLDPPSAVVHPLRFLFFKFLKGGK